MELRSKRAVRLPQRLTPTVVVLLVVSLVFPGAVLASVSQRSEQGVLSVELEPSVDAPILVDGVVRNTGSLRTLELSAGEYELCFGTVADHLAPPCKEITVAEGATTQAIGRYEPAGELRVTVEPEGLKALVFVDGVERSQAPVNLTLSEGSSLICFADIVGYATPDCVEQVILAGTTAEVVGLYGSPELIDEEANDPEQEPDRTSWESVWSTGNFGSISRWYAENTGLSDPSSLGPVTTSRVMSTRDGQVIEDLNIRYAGSDNKAIWVRHNDVVVRNNRIYAEGARNAIWVDAGLSGVIIEYNEIDGSSLNYGNDRQTGNWGNIGIATRGPVDLIRGNRMTGVRQGAGLFPNTVVEYNFVTGLHANAPGVSTSSFGHFGGNFGFAGGTVIRRNLVESGSSGGITVYSQGTTPARDALFEENLVVGVGRGFGIRGGHSGERRHEMRAVRIEGNRFHGIFGHPNVLGEGTNAAVNLNRTGTTFTNNRWLGSNADLPHRCGTRRDTCE